MKCLQDWNRIFNLILISVWGYNHLEKQLYLIRNPKLFFVKSKKKYQKILQIALREQQHDQTGINKDIHSQLAFYN